MSINVSQHSDQRPRNLNGPMTTGPESYRVLASRRRALSSAKIGSPSTNEPATKDNR